MLKFISSGHLYAEKRHLTEDKRNETRSYPAFVTGDNLIYAVPASNSPINIITPNTPLLTAPSA